MHLAGGWAGKCLLCVVHRLAKQRVQPWPKRKQTLSPRWTDRSDNNPTVKARAVPRGLVEAGLGTWLFLLSKLCYSIESGNNTSQQILQYYAVLSVKKQNIAILAYPYLETKRSTLDNTLIVLKTKQSSTESPSADPLGRGY